MYNENLLRQRTNANGLQSKAKNDSFEEKKKPSAETEGSGTNTLDPVREPKEGNQNKPTLAESPNLYKQFGDSMSEKKYVQILQELLRSEILLKTPFDQRWVLITILERACFNDCVQDDHGISIKLKRGQLMTTFRQLADWSGTTRKVVERSIKRFLKYRILGQEVGHTKSILTVLWGLKEEDGGTGFGTGKGQERDLKEDKIDLIDRLIDNAGEARIEKIEGEEKMDKLVIVKCRSQSGIKTIRESKAFEELEPLGYSREAIREAINRMIESNPTLNINTKITNYIKSILENKIVIQKKVKTYGKDSNKRPSQQDSLRRTRESITETSCRVPCRS